MRVFFVDYCVYEDIYGELLMDSENPFGSMVFTELERALEFAKDRVSDWLKSHKPDLGCVKGRITVLERGTEDEASIDWNYDWQGNLIKRIIRNIGGYDIRPGDELPEAGTKFKNGDIVEVDRGRSSINGNIYVVSGTPDKRSPIYSWENSYTLTGMDLHHFRIHESAIKKYSGKLPDGYALLSKLYKGEIKISLRRLKEIFGDLLTGDKVVQDIIKDCNLDDDSTNTGVLLLWMMERGALELRSNVISWREAAKAYRDRGN